MRPGLDRPSPALLQVRMPHHLLCLYCLLLASVLQGLGEMMPEQLWSTTLNPETRTLRKLTIEDAGG